MNKMDNWLLKAIKDEALRRARITILSSDFKFRGYSAEQITLLILNFESKCTIADSNLSVTEMQKLLNR